MKKISGTIIALLSMLTLGAAPAQQAISIIGAVTNPGRYELHESKSLEVLLENCGGLIRTGWAKIIIISKKQSDILTVTRRYDFHSLDAERIKSTMNGIYIEPGEIVFIQERVE